MTWGEIKTKITGLGFEKINAYSKNQQLYIDGVNRAIAEIASTFRPILGRYLISQYPIPNLLSQPLYKMDIVQYALTPLSYTASGVKAYYFECDGNGFATLSNGDEVVEIQELESNRQFKAYKGFVDGDVTLTFSGKYTYNIRNVALYGMTYSDNENDIPPYSQDHFHDMLELTKIMGDPEAIPPTQDQYTFADFALDKPVMQGSFSSSNTYKKVEDYDIIQRRYIRLNAFEVGQFEVWYKKRPIPITKFTADDYEIELDFEVQELVPILSAHYIWLDSDERIAMQYLNRYLELKATIEVKSPELSQVTEFDNALGW